MIHISEELVRSLLEDDNVPFAEINLKKHKGTLTYLEVRLKAIDEEGIAWIMKVLDYANQRNKKSAGSGDRVQGTVGGSVETQRNPEPKIDKGNRLKYRDSS